MRQNDGLESGSVGWLAAVSQGDQGDPSEVTFKLQPTIREQQEVSNSPVPFWRGTQ